MTARRFICGPPPACTKGGQHLDAGEFLDVVRMPFAEALQKVLHGEIKDSKTQIGLMKYALLQDKA